MFLTCISLFGVGRLVYIFFGVKKGWIGYKIDGNCQKHLYKLFIMIYPISLCPGLSLCEHDVF
jgi:hypothetical protein